MGPHPAGSALRSSQAWDQGWKGQETLQRAKDPTPGALLSMSCPEELCQVEASAGKWGRNTLPSAHERLIHIIYGRTLSPEHRILSLEGVGDGESPEKGPRAFRLPMTLPTTPPSPSLSFCLLTPRGPFPTRPVPATVYPQIWLPSLWGPGSPSSQPRRTHQGQEVSVTPSILPTQPRVTMELQPWHRLHGGPASSRPSSFIPLPPTHILSLSLSLSLPEFLILCVSLLRSQRTRTCGLLPWGAFLPSRLHRRSPKSGC